jgi:ligand-binding SRPBCC domain-containing protein
MITIAPDDQTGYRLRAEMMIDLPREQVFDFFADAMELERITPPWLQFSVLTPPPIEIKKGQLLDYRLKLHGIPINWRTEIAEWEPPFRFVDQQLRGPYQRWYHEHTFHEIDGKTLVCDDVHYILRGGRLIRPLLQRMFVGPDLEKIFRFRQDRLAQIFAAKIADKSSAEICSAPTPQVSATSQQLETSSGLHS